MTAFTGADVLAVFVKEPRAGRVKSRLAAALGPEAAAAVYRVIAEEVVRRTAPPRDAYERVIVFDPPEAAGTVGGWLGVEAAGLLPQSPGDIGVRMERAFALLFERGARRVALTGTDVPALAAEDVRRALESLDEHDVAIGPATDGGYYLIALKRPQPELFEVIAWSGPDVLSRTLERASRCHLSVRVLRTIGDVDTVEDLAAEWERVRPLLDDEVRKEIEKTMAGLI
jgi:rSAM/selenodomain-associated transferase 1